MKHHFIPARYVLSSDAMRFCSLIAGLLFCRVPAAIAGPPYVTDDPEPAPYGHVETYLYSDGAVSHGRFGETETGYEVNWGAAPNLQLSAAIPLEYGSGSRLQIGTPEVGAKYRFIQEDEAGWRPQVSVYPQVEFSVGRSATEEGATHYLFPVWAQKSFGEWTAFGGGGYRINPGVDHLNSWLSGAALQRTVTDSLSIGIEAYGETKDTRDESGLIGLGLGAIQELNENFEILGSGGPVFRAGRTDIAYYVAIGWHR